VYDAPLRQLCLDLGEPAAAELLEIGDGVPLGVEQHQQLRALLRLRAHHRRARHHQLRPVPHPIELRDRGEDALAHLRGVPLEDGDRLGDGGDLGDVARLEEVLLRRLDQPMGRLRIAPIEVERHCALAGAHGEPLLEQADQRVEALLVVERAEHQLPHTVLEPPERRAVGGPALEQLCLVHQRDQVRAAKDRLGGRARGRVGVAGHRPGRVAERRHHLVSLREDLRLDVVGAAEQPGRRCRAAGDPEEDRRRENCVPAQRRADVRAGLAQRGHIDDRRIGGRRGLRKLRDRSHLCSFRARRTTAPRRKCRKRTSNPALLPVRAPACAAQRRCAGAQKMRRRTRDRADQPGGRAARRAAPIAASSRGRIAPQASTSAK